MPVHLHPYRSACGFITCLLAWAFLYPFYWSLNALTSCFLPTTKDILRRSEESIFWRPISLAICIPVLLFVGAVTLPLAVVGVLLWLPCQGCRHAYAFIHDPGVEVRQIHTDDLLQEPFVISSMNVCLLPECLARLGNLSDTNRRASLIGTIIAQANCDIYRDESVFDLKDSGNSSDLDRTGNGVAYPCLQSVQNGKLSQRGEVSPLLTNKSAVSPQHSHASEGLGAAAADIVNGISSTEDGGAWMSENMGYLRRDDHLCVLPPPAYHHSNSRCKSSSETLHSPPAASLSNRDINISLHPSRHSVATDTLQVNSPEDPNHPFYKEHRERSQSQSRSRTNSNRLSASASGESGIASATSSHRRCSNNRSTRNSSSASSSFLSHEEIFCHFISDTFPPDLDFLCLQEVYEQRAGNILVQKLHHQFPFILYDVGNYGIKCNQHKMRLSLLNSGLLFASRFPIEDAVFKQFKNSTGLDSFCAKGILMVKVRLRHRHRNSGGVVAFISNLHLQDGTDCSSLRKAQLNNIQDWLAEFRRQSNAPSKGHSHGDRVAFDILCGDFHFDNESTADEECWSHSLMTHYQDPGRICQGKDKPWTVGTELIKSKIHDPDVDMPKAMKDMLTIGTKRGEYVESVVVNGEDGIPPLEPQSNGKRRSDFILYNLETTQTNLNVEEYHFVTQLSGLTDHLPLAMKYHVSSR